MTHILFLDPSKSSKRRWQATLPRRGRSVSVPHRAGPTTFARVSVKSRGRPDVALADGVELKRARAMRPRASP